VIGYRCDRCGVRIPQPSDIDAGHRFTFTDIVDREHHFCSVPCLVAFCIDYGCYKPPADGVVDAEIGCGSQSPRSGSDCKFSADHAGTHVSHRGEEWSDNFALIWHLEQAVRAAFAADDGSDHDNGVHYRGKAVGLQTAIDIINGKVVPDQPPATDELALDYRCFKCRAHYDDHSRDDLSCPAYTGPAGVVFSETHRYSGRDPHPEGR